MSESRRTEVAGDVTLFLDSAPKELQELKADLAQCRAEVIKLVDENKRLLNELKHQIRVRINLIEKNRRSGLADTVAALQEERDRVLEERDETIALFKRAIAEVNRLDAEIKNKNDYIAPHDFEAAVLKLKDDHLRKVESVERQLQITQKELRSASSSVHQLTWRLLRDGGTTLDDNQVRIGDVLHAMENLQKQYNDLEVAHQNMQTKLELKDQQLDKYRSRSSELEFQLEHLKDRDEQLEVQISQALRHAEASVLAAELAVAERNTMATHVQDLQKIVEQLQKKVTESDLNQRQQVTEQVDRIRLELEANQADIKAQLTVALEKAKAFEDETARVSRERHELSEKLSKLMEGEKLERQQRLEEEKLFRETTIQDVMDKKKDLIDERIRREAAEKRLQNEAEEKKRVEKKLADAERAFGNLKEEAKRIQSSMVHLKNESDKLAEERLQVERELRRKQEEENANLREEINRLLKKISRLEDIHNKVECEFRKQIAKVHRRATEYKKTIEVLEDRMRRQAGLISAS